ncbi:GNAT family N-acetyltransferase [Parabacteroides goldsteinii]|uniref:GNAT family N-acetyltransferase n=1 Tax=Parabacteroides goldsteinii TaxID=328812 RepID=UPI00242FEB0E|nr:GNAT family N-acetyltransferase [Parabacteroides goldsteinii]
MDSPLYGYECCTFLIFANFEEITNTKTGAYIVNRFKSNKSMIINNNEIVIKPIQEEEGQDFQEMYGDVAEQNHTYEIGYLIGEEEFLNRGIGKRIIQILEDKIIEIGGKEIAADPAEENIISIKTLLSNGFKKKNDGDYRKICKMR